MLCDLVRTMTPDGFRLDGALHTPASVGGRSEGGDPAGRRFDAVITLHGVGGNFYTSSLFEGLTPKLLDAGVAVLWANTRGHDTLFAASAGMRGRCWMGAAVERVEDCRHDVAGWLNWLADRGYARLGVIGHSLGAIKAVYSQAFHPDPRVTGVAAISPPRLSYTAFQYDARAGQFQESISAARLAVRDGRADQLLNVTFPYTQWMAAGTYLEKYGPEERYNLLKFVDRLTCPVWFAYGERELNDGSTAFTGLPAALRQAARPGQALEVVEVPGADHNYSGAVAGLSERLRPWLLGG